MNNMFRVSFIWAAICTTIPACASEVGRYQLAVHGGGQSSGSYVYRLDTKTGEIVGCILVSGFFSNAAFGDDINQRCPQFHKENEK